MSKLKLSDIKIEYFERDDDKYPFVIYAKLDIGIDNFVHYGELVKKKNNKQREDMCISAIRRLLDKKGLDYE